MIALFEFTIQEIYWAASTLFLDIFLIALKDGKEMRW